MATARLYNRVKVNTSTTGTGTVTLGSAVSNSFCTFAEAGAANNDVVTYVIEEGNDFEIGRGTYTSAGTTLSRTTVLLSKISGTSGTTKMNLAGSATVRITEAKEDLDVNDFTSNTAPAIDDLFWQYDTSATSKAKIRFDDYLKVINSLTQDSSPDKANDFVVTYDASASAPKKVIPNDLSRAPTAGDGITVSGFTVNYNTNNGQGVGAYLMAKDNGGSNAANNATTSGSNLRAEQWNTDGTLQDGTTQSGTWRNVSGDTFSANRIGLWIRTA